MWKVLTLLSLLLLPACVTTPRVVQYCEGKGLQPQTPQWAKCYERFERNDATFQIDRKLCMNQAKVVYPNSLYDNGRYVRRPSFRNGAFIGTHAEYYEGDWWHNRQVDNLREGIIAQCMGQKGWNDSQKWELGGKKIR